jgi:hypothetical protein
MAVPARHRITLSLAALAAVACQPAAEPADLAGICLEITTELPGAAERLDFQHPPLVLLDSAGPPQRRRMVEVPGSIPSVHYQSAWRLTPDDSLELGWTSDDAGVLVRLPAPLARPGPADTLRGRAQTLVLDGESGHGPARAVPFPCDAPLPEALRRQHPPMPTVLLEGGTVELQVGRLFPTMEVAFEILGYERYYLHEQPAGPFAGVDSLIVHTDPDGMIMLLRLVWQDQRRQQQVAAEISRNHGPPAAPQPGRAEWRDRERFILLGSGAGNGGMELLIADPRYMR